MGIGVKQKATIQWYVMIAVSLESYYKNIIFINILYFNIVLISFARFT